MVFPKTLNLARQSLLKTFTHGYAQSIVAASQSSYASQNTSLNHFHASTRFRKPNHSQFQNAFQNAALPSEVSGGKASETLHHDGLVEYYAAWQKHQKAAEEKEWQQFQFTKRIGWKSQTPAPADARPTSSGSLVVGDHADVSIDRPVLERASTTSAAREFGKATAESTQGATATSLTNDALVQDAGDRKDPSQAAFPQEFNKLDPHGLHTETAERPSHILRAPTQELSVYSAQLESLAKSQQYAQVPAVFEAMLFAGGKPAVFDYHVLLAAAIELPKTKHQIVPKALDVYADMLRRRIAPDMPIYSTLIELLAYRALDVTALKESLEVKRSRYGGMEEEGQFLLSSNETEYAILSEDQSIQTAFKLFDAATLMYPHSPFDGSTVNLLVCACAETGKVDDMVRLYGQMEAWKILPSAQTVASMIKAFASVGDLRSSVECYNEYKKFAIANNHGANTLDRNDEAVYAALVRAYGVCGRIEGGTRFLSRIENSLPDQEKVVLLRDAVALKALIPSWLLSRSFSEALEYALNKLTARTRQQALSMICISAADRNQLKVASEAFEHLLTGDTDLSRPAMAMGAMHLRNGNVDAAEPFWQSLELSEVDSDFIEPAVMHAIALIGVGRADHGLRCMRSMFAKVRATSNSATTVEQIEEAVEVVGHFLLKRGTILPPEAGMELLWTMAENGALVNPVAEHVLSAFGPEVLSQLLWTDFLLILQVQSGLIINGSDADIAHVARFSHLLDCVFKSGAALDERSSTLVEKTLVALDRPDINNRWQQYRYPILESTLSTVDYRGRPASVAPFCCQPFEDTIDPYAASTDNKGSVAIADMLEKTHGRYSSHLNEAMTKFRNMRRAGRHPRFFTYGKLIMAAAKDNRLNLARDIFAMAKQDVPYLSQYRTVRYGWATILDAMVAACLTAGQRELAAQYHQELLDIGAAPSANTFGLYITTLKESTKTFDEASEAVKIFLRAKAEGVDPSSFLYNALIGKLGKARRIDDCLFYFAEMRNLGIRPTSVTYGTIVNALCRVSDEKFAEELFEEMESMPNYKRRPAPYHSLMQFYLTTKRDRSKVLAYFERMVQSNIKPTVHTYKLLIDTYATLEPIDMAAAEHVLEEMEAAGERPEAVHYASLIHAKGCVQHDMEAARSLFDKVMADRAVRPQACLYQAVFEAIVANHCVDAHDIDAILARMKESGVDMTPYIANSLIHGWALARDIGRAERVFSSVPSDRREPSTYEAMTRAYLAVEDPQGAESVVREALCRGYPAAVAGKIHELIGGGGGARNSAAPPANGGRVTPVPSID